MSELLLMAQDIWHALCQSFVIDKQENTWKTVSWPWNWNGVSMWITIILNIHRESIYHLSHTSKFSNTFYYKSHKGEVYYEK